MARESIEERHSDDLEEPSVQALSLSAYVIARVEAAVPGEFSHAPKPTAEQEALLFQILRYGQEDVVEGLVDKPIEALTGDAAFMATLATLNSEEAWVWWNQQLSMRGTVKEIIAACYENLVLYVANRYWQFIPLEPKVDGAMARFLRAIDKFDLSLGNRFTTYASMRVILGVQEAIAKFIGVPIEEIRYINRADYIANVYAIEFNEVPSIDQLRTQLRANADGKEGRPYISLPAVERVLKEYRDYLVTPLNLLAREDEGSAAIIDFMQNAIEEADVVPGLVAESIAKLPVEMQRVMRAAFNLGKQVESLAALAESMGEDGEAKVTALLREAIVQVRPLFTARGLARLRTLKPSVAASPMESPEAQFDDAELAKLMFSVHATWQRVRIGMLGLRSDVQIAGLLGISRQAVDRQVARIKAQDPVFFEQYTNGRKALTHKAQVQKILEAEPVLTNPQVAERLAIAPGGVRAIRRDLREEGILPVVVRRSDFQTPETIRVRERMKVTPRNSLPLGFRRKPRRKTVRAAS